MSEKNPRRNNVQEMGRKVFNFSVYIEHPKNPNGSSCGWGGMARYLTLKNKTIKADSETQAREEAVSGEVCTNCGTAYVVSFSRKMGIGWIE